MRIYSIFNKGVNWFLVKLHRCRIHLFSSYVLFSQCRSRDNTLKNIVSLKFCLLHVIMYGQLWKKPRPNATYAWLRHTSKFHHRAKSERKILRICTCCVWLFYLTLLPWEFIYAKLRNFTISKRGWVVNMHKVQSLHWETKTHKLNRSIKAGFKRQLSIKRCVFAYSLFTTAELSLRGGAMGLLWQSVGSTDA